MDTELFKTIEFLPFEVLLVKNHRVFAVNNLFTKTFIKDAHSVLNKQIDDLYFGELFPLFDTTNSINHIICINESSVLFNIKKTSHGEMDIFYFNQISLENGIQDKTISFLSHELKTPAQGIVGFLNIVKRKMSNNSLSKEDMVNYLKKIEFCSERLILLLNSILDFEKLQYQSCLLKKEKFYLHDLIKDVVDIQESIFEEKGLRVNLSIIDDIEVSGSAVLLRQAFSNVLFNAIKFSHDDSEINIKALRTGHQIELSIQDFGVPIKSSDLANLSKLFEQGDAGKEALGHGVGLNLVSKIVEMHGGKVFVENNEGREGCTVRLLINDH